MRKSLPLVVLALAAGCAGYVPDVPTQEKGVSGKPLRIAPRTPPPEGEALSWDPGDGSPPKTGPVLEHAWQRAGRYTVRATGRGGTRTIEIEVVPRPALGLVPADARLAFVFPDVWSKHERVRSLLERMSPEADLRKSFDELQAKLGVDLGKTETLEAAGLDPGEGLAVVSPSDDPDAIWLLLGTLDDEKALALGRKILELPPGQGQVQSADGGRIEVARDPKGRQVALGVGGGYLFVRTGEAPERKDLPQVFSRMVLQPSGDLGGSDEYRRARAQAPGDDAIFYARADRTAIPGSAGGQAIVVGFTFGEDDLTAHLFAPLPPPQGEALRRALGGGKASSLVAKLPEGAIGYFGLSLQPTALLDVLVPGEKDRIAMEMMAAAKLGMGARELASLLSGDLAAALYLDPEAMLRSMAMEGSPGAEDVPPVLLLVSLVPGKDAPNRLAGVLVRAGAKKEGKYLTIGPSAVDLADGLLAAATTPGLLSKARGGKDLAAKIPPELLEAPGEMILYVDLGRMVDGLVGAPLPKDLTPEQRERVTARLQELSAASPFRDLLLSAHPAEGGIGGSVRVRLRKDVATASR